MIMIMINDKFWRQNDHSVSEICVSGGGMYANFRGIRYTTGQPSHSKINNFDFSI